jgi:prepilin-type N-terminal cleavage/methylation domain-containing protein
MFLINKKNNIKNKKAGFSLVETLVAITILLIAIAGPLTIASMALSDAKIAKDQVTARFLAQDALEYVRNIRDKNNAAEDPWLQDLNSCSGSCAIDSAQDTISVCGGTCPVLRYDDSSNLYGYNAGWDATPFTRSISVEELNDHEAKVSVDLTWTSARVPYTLHLEEVILNWHGTD